MYWNLILKSPRFDAFGANLTQFGCQIRHSWIVARNVYLLGYMIVYIDAFIMYRLYWSRKWSSSTYSHYISQHKDGISPDETIQKRDTMLHKDKRDTTSKECAISCKIRVVTFCSNLGQIGTKYNKLRDSTGDFF